MIVVPSLSRSGSRLSAGAYASVACETSVTVYATDEVFGGSDGIETVQIPPLSVLHETAFVDRPYEIVPATVAFDTRSPAEDST